MMSLNEHGRTEERGILRESNVRSPLLTLEETRRMESDSGRRSPLDPEHRPRTGKERDQQHQVSAPAPAMNVEEQRKNANALDIDNLLNDVNLFPEMAHDDHNGKLSSTIDTTQGDTRCEQVSVSLPSKELPSHVPTGRCLRLCMHDTWGDPHFMGLTALEVITCIPGQPAAGNMSTTYSLKALQGWTTAKLPVVADSMQANPPSLNVCGHSGDPRTFDKLVDGTNATVDDRHMWLIPYTKHGDHVLEIDLLQGKKDRAPVAVCGVRVWNYNKTVDDAHRGVKCVTFDVDGQVVYPRSGWTGDSPSKCDSNSDSPVVTLRKAHGNVDYDYGQTVWFSTQPEKYQTATQSSRTKGRKRVRRARTTGFNGYVRPVINQTYETPLLPSGHVFRLALNATWGDPYYIGLNRIEMYDEHDQLIVVRGTSSSNSNSSGSNSSGSDSSSSVGTTPMIQNDLYGKIYAHPHSVNDLLPENERLLQEASSRGVVCRPEDRIIRDGRVPGNLVCQKRDGVAAAACWLSPLRSSLDHNDMTPNYVYVTFDRPTTLSRIKIFNYSKTPSRGVSSFDIAVDDCHVYSGTLEPSTSLSLCQNGQSVLFTNDLQVCHREEKTVNYCGTKEQEVLLIDERQVMGGNLTGKSQRGVGAWQGDVVPDPSQRPMTAASTRKCK